ncbi:MAG: DNA repair protein RecN [Bacteroidales bacterium]
MLKHLTIKNYALIEELDVTFSHGFSVLTGETGAGKSIILGALGLILGQRADSQSLKDKKEKCIVEGFFDVKNLNLAPFFADNNLDWDPEQSILRREILPSGKSRAFINDTPVNLNILKELAEKLIDIHSQNKVTILQDESFQLLALDAFGGLDEKRNSYSEMFKTYRHKKQMLADLIQKENEAALEQEFYKYQYDELEAAQLIADEQMNIEEELKLLMHAEEIKTKLASSADILDREQGALDMLQNLINELKKVKSFHSKIEQVFNLFENTYFELKEASQEISRVEEHLEVEPEKIQELNLRLNLIYQLQQKHRCNNIEELIAIKNDYRKRMEAYSSLNEQIEILNAEVSAIYKELEKMASQLSTERGRVKTSFEQEVLQLIRELGMAQASFVVNLNPKRELSETGRESAMFRFNANKSSELHELAKVASGGELSRVLLAIKSLIAAKKSLPSIIFDEIDSGISGEIAGKMGGIMQLISKDMQVIAITHLPQIAARGAHHFVVFKETDNKITKTLIKELQQEERIVEIAKMLSDSTVTLPAMETAKELLKINLFTKLNN